MGNTTNCGSNCATQCYGYCGDSYGDSSTSQHTGCGSSDCTMYCAIACYQGCDGGCTGCSANCRNDCSGGCTGTCSGACTNTCKDACNAGCEDSAKFEDLILNKKFLAKDMKEINSAIEFEVVTRRDGTLKNTIIFNPRERLNHLTMNKMIENLSDIQGINNQAVEKNKAEKILPQDLINKIKAANKEEIGLP